MRAVVQRVAMASVSVSGRLVSSISRGFLVLVGVGSGDGPGDVEYIRRKITGLRVFEDDMGKMNKSLGDVGGGILLVSQFTLYGDVRQGNRPSFSSAAPPSLGLQLFGDLLEGLRDAGLPVATGEFGEHMKVELVNDGPVTILLDSGKGF